jgi:hypothetical protein
MYAVFSWPSLCTKNAKISGIILASFRSPHSVAELFYFSRNLTVAMLDLLKQSVLKHESNAH